MADIIEIIRAIFEKGVAFFLRMIKIENNKEIIVDILTDTTDNISSTIKNSLKNIAKFFMIIKKTIQEQIIIQKLVFNVRLSSLLVFFVTTISQNNLHFSQIV